MHPPLRLLVPVLLLAAAACSAVEPEPASEADAAVRAVDRWVQRHPDGWTLEQRADRYLARPEWSEPCSRLPSSGFVALRYAAGATEVDLFFRCPLPSPVRAQELQASFSHAAITRLPHGIASSGWRFDVVTPSSSVSDGVTFAPDGSGRLRITVETPLYAVYGHSTRPACQPPADAPSPPGCSLLREHRVPLTLRLSAPWDESALR